MSEKKIETGDLVASYFYNTSMYEEELLHYGIVLECNDWIGDVLVLDNYGIMRWWGAKRWRILRKNNSAKQ